MSKPIITLIIFFLTCFCQTYAVQFDTEALSDILRAHVPAHTEVGKIKVNSVNVNDKRKTVTVVCNENTSYLPFTSASVKALKDDLKKELRGKYTGYRLNITANSFPLEQLATDTRRKHAGPTEKDRFVDRTDLFEKIPVNGLDGANIALWQSHGWYFEKKLNRWEWQRARIMQTVEDLYTQSYVVPFLVPMLENAGAFVLMPRERDMTDIEIIIDNDGGLSQGTYTENNPKAWNRTVTGFAHRDSVYTDNGRSNPFRLGTARVAKASDKPAASWNADIPVSRQYAVYISYPSLENSTKKAVYTVNAADGPHKLTVNQRMGGSTWICLGKFPLAKGTSEKPLVELSTSDTERGTVVGADAVKIGGGMGNIARKATVTDDNGNELTQYITSNYPRFTEGARYWLQWAGMPDSIYSPSAGENDYGDDYKSRALWVNHMAGGSSMMPKRDGLGIPVDLSFAFHSDAGTTLNDSIIGTLGIYSTDDNSLSGNGSTRLANRDLTDMVVTSIVNDIRAAYEPEWTRRGLWDKKYYEARVPGVPAMLLELLSHQNFADMKYGLDPTFRFTVSRAIYKGMLRFLTARDGRPYTVQPLPVNSFAISHDKANAYRLTWSETADTLEPSAVPSYYIVEQRIEDGVFKPVATVTDPVYDFKATDDKIHSFRIIAGNDGGVSFPSEVLAMCHLGGTPDVNIVNAFTRVSGPDTFDAGSIAGFYDTRDHGVPYIEDISFIGSQFEFRRDIPWMDDDAAGFGASRADLEDKIVAGNTFDYVYLHGKSVKAARHGFISSSVQAFIDNRATTKIVDLILGKQKEIRVGTGRYGTKYKTFTPKLQNRITNHCKAGGSIMVTGSYVATDLWDNPLSDSATIAADKKFATEVLGYHWRVGQASVTGDVYEVVSPFRQFSNGRFEFSNRLNADCYAVASPDSFYASDDRGATVMRYGENNLVAATAMSDKNYRTFVAGFPFETIRGEQNRDLLMRQILDFLTRQ